MTDQRADGALNKFTGRLQEGLGSLTGDGKLQLDGKFKQVQGTAKDYYGRAVDALETQVERVPANLQPQARKAVQFTRDRPIATVAGLALLGLFLTRGSRR